MASAKGTSNPGGAAGPRKVPEGLRVLKAQFRGRKRRPGTVESVTHFNSISPGSEKDEVVWVPEEQVIYWTGRGETKVIPLTAVEDFTVDL